jgi:phospholipid-binding lipoprotein MlaA
MFDYDIPQTTTMGAVIKAYKVINKTSLQLGQYESIKKDALDFYPFLRDSYKQLREQQIKE